MIRIVTAVLTCLLFAGCSFGGQSGSEPAEGSASASKPGVTASKPTPAPNGPDCADIWKPGQELPNDYESCIIDGQPGEQEVINCQDGSSLVIYRDQFYAITGQPVVEPDLAPLQDTAEYGTAYTTCTGE